MADTPKAKPRDLSQPVALAEIPDGGMLAGAVGDDPVMLVRAGADIRAFGATCTHLGAPLAEGLWVGDTVRCPWHHACFSLRTGEALAAPAFDALPRWKIEQTGDTLRVTERIAATTMVQGELADHSLPGIVIVGGGAAGYSAAFELRRLGHEGPVTMVSREAAEPYDRTLLTKDYLDGKFGDDHLPIAKTTLADLGVHFLGDTDVVAIDRVPKLVRLGNGRALPYTSLLLATGAEPKQLDIPGGDLPHVHVLRSLADCRAILKALKPGARVAVVGSSFIGLEAAASIRTRGHDVTVVTPDTFPMGKVLGPDLAQAVLTTHRSNGVVFALEAEVAHIAPGAVHLADATSLTADLVVVGIGVVPRTALAAAAGLRVEDGIWVDACLRTDDPDIYAAGDIARWPDPVTGSRIRVEHWVVAERQGEAAARAMLGGTEPYRVVPFFWSKHFDLSFRYVGHAEAWDEAVVSGSLDDRKAVIRFRKDGHDLAAATVGKDLEALEIARRMSE